MVKDVNDQTRERLGFDNSVACKTNLHLALFLPKLKSLIMLALPKIGELIQPGTFELHSKRVYPVFLQ